MITTSFKCKEIQDKPELGSLPASGIENVKHPDPQFFCSPNSMVFVLTEGICNETEWLRNLTTEAPDVPPNTLAMYLTAESKTQRDDLFLKFQEVLKSNSVPMKIPSLPSRSNKPSLPPRK
jgi:hypothetical protein